MLCTESWPDYDKSLLVREKIEFVVQVNGRIRERFLLPINSPQEEVERIALESTRVRSCLTGGELIKTVFVPNRLLNIVVKLGIR